MIYADYAFYHDKYMGVLPEDEFARLSVRASSYLDYYTQNRAEGHAELEAVKMCCCALVDRYKIIEAAQELASKKLTDSLASDADVKSETVGGYSRTLASGADGAAAALSTMDGTKKLLADTCREYLAHTGLLYRGGACRCTLPTL